MRSIFYLDRNREARHTILLCSSGRSGSTWLAGLINHGNRMRLMFEPFSRRVEICGQLNPRPYRRPGEPDPELHDLCRRILSGRVRAWWVDRLNRKFLCRTRLIKEIRANLLLGWLRAEFPELKIVLLLRHPGAVAYSRLRLGWGAKLEEILSQRDLVADHLAPLIGGELAPRDDFERHLYLWCIENLVPLRQLAPGSVHILTYEHLCRDPEGELRALFAALELDFQSAVLKRLARPSKLARPLSAVRTGEDLVGAWKTKLSASQIERLDTFLHAFGLDPLYTSALMPHTREPLGVIAR